MKIQGAGNKASLDSKADRCDIEYNKMGEVEVFLIF